VLEQSLRELARAAEVISELGERDRASAQLGESDHTLAELVENAAVIVQRLRDADGATGVPQGGQILGIELGVAGRLRAGVEQPLLQRQR